MVLMTMAIKKMRMMMMMMARKAVYGFKAGERLRSTDYGVRSTVHILKTIKKFNYLVQRRQEREASQPLFHELLQKKKDVRGKETETQKSTF